MNLKHYSRHAWNLPPHKAIMLQKELSRKVILFSDTPVSKIKTVAGIDTHSGETRAIAAIVNVDLAGLQTVETATARRKITYPYIPGLLSFREGPVILSALEKLTKPPDVLLFDGQGIAHPRRFGLASHIGWLTGLPSIGCAKTRLIGEYLEPHAARGSHTCLKDRGETIGAALRTRSGVKPVYVSIGHRINLADSIHIVLQCCDRYRLPEPIRRAHAQARKSIRRLI